MGIFADIGRSNAPAVVSDVTKNALGLAKQRYDAAITAQKMDLLNQENQRAIETSKLANEKTKLEIQGLKEKEARYNTYVSVDSQINNLFPESMLKDFPELIPSRDATKKMVYSSGIVENVGGVDSYKLGLRDEQLKTLKDNPGQLSGIISLKIRGWSDAISRLQGEISKENSKDVPNRKKLSELKKKLKFANTKYNLDATKSKELEIKAKKASKEGGTNILGSLKKKQASAITAINALLKKNQIAKIELNKLFLLTDTEREKYLSDSSKPVLEKLHGAERERAKQLYKSLGDITNQILGIEPQASSAGAKPQQNIPQEEIQLPDPSKVNGEYIQHNASGKIFKKNPNGGWVEVQQ